MSTWRIKSANLTEREQDFSADFIATNLDTGKSVTITLQQRKGDPATDLIGALRALAQLLVKTSKKEEPDAPAVSSNVAGLN